MEYLLGELFELRMGKTPDRHNDLYWKEGSNRWISIADLGKCQKYIYDTKEKITDKAVKESGIKIIPQNTVIMSFKLSLGKLAITSEPIYSNEAIMAFLDKHVADISSDYLYYLLMNMRWEDNSNKAVMGKTLNKATISGVKVKIHDKLEQEKIVNILDKICCIIQQRKNQLQQLDRLVKSRFIEIFGDPITNPFGWDKVLLEDCLESIDNGKSFVCDTTARIGENPAILKLSAVTYGVYKPEENKGIMGENDFVESAEVHSGDLLFTRKNTPELVGMAAYVVSTPPRLMMPDLIFRLNTKNNCKKIFLWQLINHDLFRKKIQNIASGSAKSMSNISKERLGKLSIYLPPLELQNRFAAFVHYTDKLKLHIDFSSKINFIMKT